MDLIKLVDVHDLFPGLIHRVLTHAVRAGGVSGRGGGNGAVVDLNGPNKPNRANKLNEPDKPNRPNKPNRANKTMPKL